MSDIYLQITETPTVVTLSAPVVSGALASTVTVANTVTVALDSNSLSALENVTVTVGAAITGTVTVSNFPASQAVTFSAVSISNLPATQAVSLASVPTHGVTLASTTVTVSSLPAISGTVTALNLEAVLDQYEVNAQEKTFAVVAQGSFDNQGYVSDSAKSHITNSVTIGSLPALVAGTANIGVVTIGNIRRSGDGALTQLTTEVGSGALQTVVGAGTAQIGSVTVGNSVTIGSCVTHGVTIANTVVTFYPLQGTAVSNTNFTSVTPSTTLVSAVAGREVLTVFNESGTLFISPGATCTTVSYQVRLLSGDYWECPNGQLSLQHTGVYLSSGGTARVTDVS